METLFLTTDGDLSQATYEEASRLLREKNDLPLHLLAQESELAPIGDWLWEKHRITAITYLPLHFLEDSSRWALCGSSYAVVGGRF